MIRRAGYGRIGAALGAVTAASVAVAVFGLPALAGARAGQDPVITVTAGGDRTGDTSVAGLAGVTFDFYAGVAGTQPSGTPVASCVTGADGRCSVDVAARGGGSGAAQAGYWVVQAAVPAGWFASPYLDTGSATSITATNYSRLFVANVTANVSVPIATTTNTATATARGSAWASTRDNPPLPDKCGLKVALLFDLSGSIGPDIGQLRSAGTSFVDALTGTPSSVGVYTFASYAPANTTNNSNLGLTSVSTAQSAATVTTKIKGLTVQTTNAGTNWDQGLWQIAADPTNYDVAVVLTDGNPTFYGPTARGPGSYTRFIEVENGIFSANALKARATTVLAVGIGSSVGSSTDNLVAISGPQEGTDYFTTDFASLADLLKTLALKNCQGTVNVVKKVVPASAPGDLNAAIPAPGWQFSASPGTVQPQHGTTDENGAVSFATKTSSSQPVTLTETEQDGYQLIQQDGKNASCRSSTGAPATVANTGALGFTVNAVANESITCVVYNQEPAPPDPASVVVHKTWDINGVTLPDGDQDPDFQASLVLDPVHPPGTQPVWGEEFHGYLAGDEVIVGEDHVTVPRGCSHEASGDFGRHVLSAGLNRFRVVNTVTCTTKLTLVKHVVNYYGGTAEPTDWTLSARPEEGTVPPAPTLSGVTGSPEVTGVSIPPGVQYTLSESGPAGYSLENLSCVITGTHEAVPVEAGTLTASIGQDITCTFTNVESEPPPTPTPTPTPSPTPTPTPTPTPSPTRTPYPRPTPTYSVPSGGAPTGSAADSGDSGLLIGGGVAISLLGCLAGAGTIRRRRSMRAGR